MNGNSLMVKPIFNTISDFSEIQIFPKTHITAPSGGEWHEPLSHHRPLKIVRWCRRFKKIGVKHPWLFYNFNINYIEDDNGQLTIPFGYVFRLMVYDRADYVEAFGREAYDTQLSNDVVDQVSPTFDEMTNIAICHSSIKLPSMEEFEENKLYYYHRGALHVWLACIAYIREVRRQRIH